MTPNFLFGLLYGACTCFMIGCTNETTYPYPDTIVGYRPVYGESQTSEIKLQPPRRVHTPGKIYTYGNYLLVNEVKAGIHVFNNQNPANPQPVAFIQLLGNTDMAIRDNVLYADHLGNLVAIEVGDFRAIKPLGSLPLKQWNLGLPPPAGYYFECVDPEKGLVADWKEAELKNPKCYAIQ